MKRKDGKRKLGRPTILSRKGRSICIYVSAETLAEINRRADMEDRSVSSIVSESILRGRA
jgi:hypothetical protein